MSQSFAHLMQARLMKIVDWKQSAVERPIFPLIAIFLSAILIVKAIQFLRFLRKRIYISWKIILLLVTGNEFELQWKSPIWNWKKADTGLELFLLLKCFRRKIKYDNYHLFGIISINAIMFFRFEIYLHLTSVKYIIL